MITRPYFGSGDKQSYFLVFQTEPLLTIPNVDLLDFEKIKEIFSDQIFYHHFYNGYEGSMEIGIDKIVLSYFI